MLTGTPTPTQAAVPTRPAVLWTCIGLFFLRVVGQLEVLLLSPNWLPPMSAWYSGLLPYPLLVPIQVALLMLMCVLTLRTRRVSYRTAARLRAIRIIALLYFAAMAVRLAIVVRMHGPDFYLCGAIPVAFHWVLALFVLVWARSPFCTAAQRKM